jgi:hypothetical protein
MSYDDGEAGQVEGMSYCMKRSIEAKNVDSMSEAMGYHNMADRANTPKPPTQMKAAKSNPQLSPQAGNGKYDYDKDR